jgi:MFS family permease
MAEALGYRPPATDEDKDEINRFAFLLRALRHRNYRLYFAGQLISLIGTFLTQVATVWLVFRITHRAEMLGVVGFAGQIPMFVLGPFAGVWVDRINRRRLLVITQSLAMLQSFALAGLALMHVINVPEIIGLAIFQGIINAFDMPGRQTFLVEIVTDRSDLANAIALNSTMVHGARLIGPAIAGLLIAWVGEGLCFLIDGISYIAVIAALLAMRLNLRQLPAPRSVMADLTDGFRYALGFPPIRVLLMLMAVFSLSAMPALQILMPIFADHFGGNGHGAQTLGFLMTASGGGALIGSLYLASRKTVVGLGRVIVAGSTTFAICLIAFAFSTHLWLSLIICVFAGLAMLINFASANTLIQTFVDDHMRGRVMSLFTVCFIGMTPWGNLLAGEMATWLSPVTGSTAQFHGAARALIIEGIIALLVALNFARKLPKLRPLVRALYVKKGILPGELATAMQSAAEVTEGAG